MEPLLAACGSGQQFKSGKEEATNGSVGGGEGGVMDAVLAGDLGTIYPDDEYENRECGDHDEYEDKALELESRVQG
jgi:hypothetical protein